MDLKAASDQDARAHLFTRIGMTVCFVAAGALLIGTLAIAQSQDIQTDTSLSTTMTSNSK
jgi:hypothetical protein